MIIARSRRWSLVLGIICGIAAGLIQAEASSLSAAPNKGPPINVEVSSLDGLKQALAKATPGSVIRLTAGIYQIYADDPYLLIKGVQGLPDQPIVIQGATGGGEANRPTIIDGGRSLDPMLGLVEHYRRAGSRPVELDEILIRTRFRTERAINCFVFENSAYLVPESDRP